MIESEKYVNKKFKFLMNDKQTPRFVDYRKFGTTSKRKRERERERDHIYIGARG